MTRNFCTPAGADLKRLCNAVDIAMREFYPLRARQPYAINNAGVIVLIGKNQVMPFNERREHADIGGVSGAEVERGFGALEFRKLPFNPGERFAVSSKQAGSCGSATVVHDGLCHLLFYQRMGGKAEIVVG